MEKFNFKKNIIDKKIEVMVQGFFTEQDGSAYINEYKRIIGSIKPHEYELVLDCKGLLVTAQGLVEMLQGVCQMYKQDGFKKVKIITKSPADGGIILKMQLKRIVSSAGLDNAEIIAE